METSTSKLSEDVEALSLSDNASSYLTTLQSSNCGSTPLSHRYGALVSQYDIIPASVVTLLEEAILYHVYSSSWLPIRSRHICTAPVPALPLGKRWGETFEILRDWLLHKTRYQETKRQVLLGTLQTEMLENVVHAARQQDILLQAQRMLDLVPTLCEEAQQKFRGTFINWRNSI